MRHATLKFVIIAIALGLTRFATGVTEPQPAMASMTVAQLEKAGDAARSQKDYELAVKYFQAALVKDRKNAVVYNKMGLAELKNGNFDASRSAFQKAIKINPKYTDALNNLGAVEYTQANFKGAIKQFKKAVALDETRATFHVNLGAAWFAQKKVERAIVEYARALELDPQALGPQTQTGVAAQIASPEERAKYSYMLAKIHAKRGDVEQCLRCLQMAKEQGYRDLANVYRDEEFSGLRNDARLAEIVPPRAPK